MIIGRTTRLRALEREDIDRFLVWFNDPEVTEHLSVYLPLSRAQEERWFDAQLDDADQIVLAVETADGRHIGNVGLHHIDRKNSHAELGIVIGEKDCWNRGYGTDAVHVLLRFAFGELNLNRVYLRVFEDNARAIACYEGCGFQHEGRQRAARFHNGAYQDVLLMGILRDEFVASAPKQRSRRQHS